LAEVLGNILRTVCIDHSVHDCTLYHKTGKPYRQKSKAKHCVGHAHYCTRAIMFSVGWIRKLCYNTWFSPESSTWPHKYITDQFVKPILYYIKPAQSTTELVSSVSRLGI